jgi:hypothetical protein
MHANPSPQNMSLRVFPVSSARRRELKGNVLGICQWNGDQLKAATILPNGLVSRNLTLHGPLRGARPLQAADENDNRSLLGFSIHERGLDLRAFGGHADDTLFRAQQGFGEYQQRKDKQNWKVSHAKIIYASLEAVTIMRAHEN